MFKHIINRRASFIGIDIQPGKVLATRAHCAKGVPPKLEAVESQASSVDKRIQEIKKKINYRNEIVSMALPSKKVVMKEFEFKEAVKKEEIIKYISYRAKDIYNYTDEKILFDIMPVSEDDKRHKCVFVRKSSVDFYYSLAKRHKLKLRSINVDLLSIGINFRLNNPMSKKRCICIFNVGEQGALMSVHDASGVLYSREFKINKSGRPLAALMLIQKGMHFYRSCDEVKEVESVYTTGLEYSDQEMDKIISVIGIKPMDLKAWGLRSKFFLSACLSGQWLR
jgi:Tfp pilus assembly PilM family ATPase